MRKMRHARLGVIVVASFVLLVTVLPQLASGIGLGALTHRLLDSAVSCSSGSSGSGSVGSSSSQCSLPPGTLTGKVTVTGGPKGFDPPYEGIGICPSADSTAGKCTDPNPDYALASNGVYTISLAPGAYRVTGFYELNPYGGAFLGTTYTVNIVSGVTVTHNAVVPYRAPAALKGTVSVTGVPAGDAVQQLSVVLCPSFDPYNGTNASIACVTGYGQQASPGVATATYKITGLPPGSWTAYPSYCTEYGCDTNANAGKPVTLSSNVTSTVKVTTPFVTPSEGLLTASVTITGAPAKNSDEVAVQACQPTTTTQPGVGCQTYYGIQGEGESLLLADGKWTVTGYYLASPFDNAVPGATQTVTITGGHNTVLSLAVPYRVPGTAAGSIIVVGAPPNVPITSYTLVACPASAPLTTGEPSLECASEYSGPGGYGYGAADRDAKASSSDTTPTNGTSSPNANVNPATKPPAGFSGPATAPYNVYKVDSLSPGSWLLYPGYQTVLGSFTASQGTAVTVKAGGTVTRQLLVPYQKPTVGAVVGRVDVVDAPANGFESGVQACTGPPTTASPCPGQEDAYSQSGGDYQLVLAPGTWWVSGFVTVFSGSEDQTTTAPRRVVVAADTVTTENFTVVAS